MNIQNPKPEKNLKDFFLLDVRTPQEFQEANIKSSINIPVINIPSNLQKLKNINKPILIICRSGARAKSAQNFLNQNNIKNSKVLKGGLLENPHLIK